MLAEKLTNAALVTPESCGLNLPYAYKVSNKRSQGILSEWVPEFRIYACLHPMLLNICHGHGDQLPLTVCYIFSFTFDFFISAIWIRYRLNAWIWISGQVCIRDRSYHLPVAAIHPLPSSQYILRILNGLHVWQVRISIAHHGHNFVMGKLSG